MIRKAPIARIGIKRPTTPEPKRRTRKCALKSCRQLFEPRTAMHVCCSIECALAHVDEVNAKKERKATRIKLAALKTRSAHMKEAQAAFNSVIRLRDRLAGYACISSGRPLDWTGNAVDAGHYRSVGSAPHLRFNEDNVHAQSKHDNQFKSGNAVDYRLGLIARIGLDRVEALEANQTPRKYSIEELKAIKSHYQQKLKELKNA